MEEREIRQHLRTAFANAGYNFDNYNITISVSNRMKKTLGWCEVKSKNGIPYPSEIRISNYLLENSELSVIKDVIYHDAAHALVAIETRENHGHDAVFKAMCKRVGTTNDGAITQSFEITNPEKFYKYTTYCAECGKMTGGHSRSCKATEFPYLYRSKCCKAGIIVQQNW